MAKVLELIAAGPKTIDALCEGLGMHTFELNVPIQRLRKEGKIEQDGREWLQRGIRSYWVTRWRLTPDTCRTCLRDITEHEDPDNTGFAFCRESGCSEFKGGHGAA